MSFVIRAEDFDFEHCEKLYVWQSDKFETETRKIVLSKDSDIQWIVGFPGSGKSMLIRTIIGEELKRKKHEVLPILIPMQDYNTLANYDKFDIWLSLKIISSIMNFLDLYDLKSSFKEKIWDLIGNIFGKDKENWLKAEYVEGLTSKFLKESEKEITKKTVEYDHNPLLSLFKALIKRKDEAEDLKAVKEYTETYGLKMETPFEILTLIILSINEKFDLPIILLFDDIDFLARNNEINFFVNYTKKLLAIDSTGKMKLGVKAFLYKLIYEKMKTEIKDIAAHKLTEYNISIIDDLFDETFRNEFLTTILAKRLTLEKNISKSADELQSLLTQESGLWWAALGSMGNVRRFFQILSYAKLDWSVLITEDQSVSLREIKRVTTNPEKPLYEDPLEESLKCIMPEKYFKSPQTIIKLTKDFFSVILNKMKNQQKNIPHELEKEIGNTVLFFEIDKELKDEFIDVFLCLENSGLIVKRASTSFISTSSKSDTYIINLSSAWEYELSNKNKNTIGKYYNRYRTGDDRLNRESKEARNYLITKIEANDIESFRNLTKILRCTNCGNIITPDDIFCSKCGNKVSEK